MIHLSLYIYMLNNYLQYHIINSLYICSGISFRYSDQLPPGPCHETSMTTATCRPVGGPAMVPWLMSMSLWGGLYNYVYIYTYIYVYVTCTYYIYICVYSIYTILCMTYYLCDVRMTHAHKWNKSRLFSPLSFSQLVSDLLRFSARLHSALLSFLNVCATHVSLLSFLWSSQSALVYVAFFLSFQEEV